MCGRFTLTILEGFPSMFEIDDRPPLVPRYNIAPSQNVAVVRQMADGLRKLDMMKWGLIPHWTKPGGAVSSWINARSETAHSRPSFREAFRFRRCLVPADGFFEWKKSGPQKLPYYFRLKSRGIFAFAGLWDSWPGPESPVQSCTILTTEPNRLVRSLHDRMPVILPPDSFQLWLDTERYSDRLTEILGPYPAHQMECFAVSRAVNSPLNDSPECIRPLPGQTNGQDSQRGLFG